MRGAATLEPILYRRRPINIVGSEAVPHFIGMSLMLFPLFCIKLAKVTRLIISHLRKLTDKRGLPSMPT